MFHAYIFLERNVGPIHFTFTSHSIYGVARDTLIDFEEELNNIQAKGGGDYREYAYGAMLAALNYSANESGREFIPMRSHSELIVITDAQSKQEDLKPIVIQQAITQGVSIHFILSGGVDASYYESVAIETGGNIFQDEDSKWYLVSSFFHNESHTSIPERKKRYLPSSPCKCLSIDVSIFAHSLRVATLTRSAAESSAESVAITLPNNTIETAEIKNNVMLYLKFNPMAGYYYFNFSVDIDEALTEQDVTLDVRILYVDSNLTIYSSKPPSACKFQKMLGPQSSRTLNFGQSLVVVL